MAIFNSKLFVYHCLPEANGTAPSIPMSSHVEKSSAAMDQRWGDNIDDDLCLVGGFQPYPF